MGDEDPQVPNLGQPQERALMPRHAAVERDDAGNLVGQFEAQAVCESRPLGEAGEIDSLRMDVVAPAGLLNRPHEVVLQER